MLKNILVVCILIASAYGASQLTILNSPKSLQFKGTDKIESGDLGEVVTAALGQSIHQPSGWTGMSIVDPFATPRGVIFVTVNGVESFNFEQIKPITFQVTGSDIHDSLADASERVKDGKSVAVNLDLTEGIAAFEPYNKIFGDIKAKPEKISSSLKPDDHVEDKAFLNQLALLNGLTNALSAPKMTLPAFLNIHLDVSAMSYNAAAQADALKLLTAAVEKLTVAAQNSYKTDDVLVLSYTSKDAIITRTRRAAAVETKGDPTPANLNLAKTYSEDYPVIFNIMLWFGVVIAFSLLAISYAIATMDPGRDSIIYRMTSNRIKKDN